MPNGLAQWQEGLLRRHQLPQAYLDHAQQWFAPLAKTLAEHQLGANRPVLVAVNGCQGSGKTTVCDLSLPKTPSTNSSPLYIIEKVSSEWRSVYL